GEVAGGDRVRVDLAVGGGPADAQRGLGGSLDSHGQAGGADQRDGCRAQSRLERFLQHCLFTPFEWDKGSYWLSVPGNGSCAARISNGCRRRAPSRRSAWQRQEKPVASSRSPCS